MLYIWPVPIISNWGFLWVREKRRESFRFQSKWDIICVQLIFMNSSQWALVLVRCVLRSSRWLFNTLVFKFSNLCNRCSDYAQSISCYFTRRTGYFNSSNSVSKGGDTGSSNSVSKGGELQKVKKYTYGFKHIVTLCKGITWWWPVQDPVKFNRTPLAQVEPCDWQDWTTWEGLSLSHLSTMYAVSADLKDLTQTQHIC